MIEILPDDNKKEKLQQKDVNLIDKIFKIVKIIVGGLILIKALDTTASIYLLYIGSDTISDTIIIIKIIIDLLVVFLLYHMYKKPEKVCEFTDNSTYLMPEEMDDEKHE